MVRSVPDLLILLAAKPLLLAAVVGGIVAWPVGGATATAAARVVVLAVATAAAELGPSAPSRFARTISTVGILGLVATAVLQRLHEPAFGLVALVAGTSTVLHAWRPDPVAPHRPPRVVARRTPVIRTSPVGAVLTAFALVAVPREVAVPRVAVLLLHLALGTAVLGASVARDPRRGSLVDTILGSPARLLVASFLALSTLGSALLVLPVATTRPGSLQVVDAVFTAVSAACVTGLAVIDPSRDLTPFGQLVVLVLVQLGGLGIMTFAAAATVVLGRRLGVREEAATADLMGGVSARRDLEQALGTVVRVTAWTEGLGALVLAPLFVAHGDGIVTAVWRAIFTAISAFCNAGLVLHPEGMAAYRDDPAVLLVVGTLVIVGGVGPLVVAALPALRRRRGSLHLHLVLTATAALVAVPTVLFLFLEWNGVLEGLSPLDKLVNGWFQAVATRTAGFASVDVTHLHPATWTMSVLLMLVGGSPGSTAGGMKTTTVAVLLLAVVAAVRGHVEATAFGRRIPHRSVYEATAIATVFLLSIAFALTALQVTQRLPLDLALFEVVSALGTAGLSLGGTAQVDAVGKVILTACMFAGRVGPLTLFIFFTGRAAQARRYPLEPVQVG